MGYKFYPAFAFLVGFILSTLIAIFYLLAKKKKGIDLFTKKAICAYIFGVYMSWIGSSFLFPITFVYREYFACKDVDIYFLSSFNERVLYVLLLFIPIGILIGILCNKFKALCFSILIPSLLYGTDYLFKLYRLKESSVINLYMLLISIIGVFLGYVLYNIKTIVTHSDKCIDDISDKTAKSIDKALDSNISFLSYLFNRYF